METYGRLTKSDGRFEFRCDEMNLVVRGDYAEWVLNAAAEMMDTLARKEMEGRLDELETLCEFGEADPVELDVVKWDMKSRFEILPQCTVTIGSIDYKWIAPEGRDKAEEDFAGHPVKRVQNMALTRNDSFLVNENGVDTSSQS